MENNSFFPLKYRIRKTDELVEIVAWETVDKGARSEADWVSYIDAQGNEHIKEHLTLEWDFVIQTPFEKGFLDALKPDLPTFDLWDARRYELTKEYVMRDLENDKVNVDKAIAFADDIIAALKNSSGPKRQMDEESQEQAKVTEPSQVSDALNSLRELGYHPRWNPAQKSITFYYFGSKCTFFPRNGYFNGKGLRPGYGLDNLIEQLSDNPQPICKHEK